MDRDNLIAQIPSIQIENSHLDEGAQCGICLKDYTLGESVRRVQCGHFFHTDCIVTWLRSKTTCPYCRTKVLLMDEQRIPRRMIAQHLDEVQLLEYVETL